MKKVLLAVTLAGILLACHKKADDVTPPPATKVAPSFKNNPAYPDMVMIGAKTDTVIASFYVNPNDGIGMTVTGQSSIRFIYSGVFKPSTGYKKIYFTVTGPGIMPVKSETKQNVIDAEDYFDQWSRSFAPNTGYLIEVHSEITSFATDGTGVDEKCAVVFKMVYQVDGTMQNKTMIDTAQTITFKKTASSTLTVSRDPSSPTPKIITGNQEFEAIRMNVTSVGGTSVLTQQDFHFGGIVGLPAVIPEVRVYDGATLVGSGPVFTAGNGRVLASVNLNNYTLPVNTTKMFSVRLVMGIVGVNASGQSFNVISDSIIYIDAGGIIKANTVVVGGDKFHLLKSMQTITSIPLSGNLQNGVLKDGYTISVLSTAGNSASKQFAFDVTLTDNGTHVDTLRYKNLYFKVNGVVATNVTFTNSLGQVIDSIGPGDKRVYVTFINESINPVNTPTEYILGGRLLGFNHPPTPTGPGDGDVASIILVTTDDPNVGSPIYKFVNSGVIPNNITAKIWTSPTANSGAIIRNIIWSDMSAGSAHSFIYGVGTADAYDGLFGITFNSVNAQVWGQ